LVATFGLLEDAQSKRMRKAVTEAQGSKTHKGRIAICAFLAESCTALEYKGNRVDDNAGFGPNMRRVLKAPQGASQGDLVWLCTKEDLDVLAKFYLKVQKWSEDPVTSDLTEAIDGPF